MTGPLPPTLSRTAAAHGLGSPPMRDFFAPLEASLKQMIAHLGAPPKAILMISGHWEENEVSIMGAAKPPMIYDYSGFPPHTYEITYDAPGAPVVAACAHGLLQQAGIAVHIDLDRGFDHGLYAPMKSCTRTQTCRSFRCQC